MQSPVQNIAKKEGKQKKTPTNAFHQTGKAQTKHAIQDLNHLSVQAKLHVGASNDVYEREADAVADRIVQTPLSQLTPKGISSTEKKGIQRKCSACQEEDIVQRKPLPISSTIQAKPSEGGIQTSAQVSSQIQSSRGGGTTLSGPALQKMESGFGRDLSHVRIHTGGNAASLSRQLNAKAFTVGNDIYFGAGQYQPHSPSGQHLLAHELTHTIQQSGNQIESIQRTVDRVEINCADDEIRFIHDGQTTSYGLNHCNLTENTYQAGVTISQRGSRIDFDLGEVPPGTNFDFNYDIEPGQPNPATFFAGQTSVTVDCSNTASPMGTSLHFNARRLSPEDVTALTGRDLSSFPMGTLVAIDSLVQNVGGPATVGASRAAPTPFSFIPRNTTGILWTEGHASIFANPSGPLASPTIRGYRGNLAHYMGEYLPSIGRRFTLGLHEGVPGSFTNDSIFPLLPGQQEYIIVPRTPAQAEAFATRLQGTNYGGDYTYSPPRAPGAGDPILGDVGRTEGQIHDTLRARGRAPFCTNNCITVPATEIEAAIGGRPRSPSGVDVMTGEGPSGAVEPAHAGRARIMTEAMSEGPLPPGAQRLSIRVTTGGSASMFLVRGAGYAMLVYGIYQTEERIRASIGSGQTATVVSEEVGTWTGGILGSALGGAAAGALVCAPTGPIDAVCVLGGFVGGLAVGAVGAMAGHAIGHEAGEHIVQPITDSIYDTVGEYLNYAERSIYHLYRVPYMR